MRSILLAAAATAPERPSESRFSTPVVVLLLLTLSRRLVSSACACADDADVDGYEAGVGVGVEVGAGVGAGAGVSEEKMPLEGPPFSAMVRVGTVKSWVLGGDSVVEGLSVTSGTSRL